MPGLELFLIIILSLFWLQLIVLPHWNQCIKGFITHSVSNFSKKPIAEKARSASTEVGLTVFRALNSKSRYLGTFRSMLWDFRCFMRGDVLCPIFNIQRQFLHFARPSFLFLKKYFHAGLFIQLGSTSEKLVELHNCFGLDPYWLYLLDFMAQIFIIFKIIYFGTVYSKYS